MCFEDSKQKTSCSKIYHLYFTVEKYIEYNSADNTIKVKYCKCTKKKIMILNYDIDS